MCVIIIIFSLYDVINFEINVSFIISFFVVVFILFCFVFLHEKCQDKFQIFIFKQEQKDLSGEIKNYFS